MESVATFSENLSGFVWGWPDAFPVMVALLLVTGLCMTVALRFIQVRKLKHSLDVVRGKYDDPNDAGDLSHFQALTTALSATVGIGNIAGVATAIHYGGPGALFWMWVTAAFGMALKYAECTLAQRYRTILPDGTASGGPMYYIEKGLGPKWKPLAIFFACCAVISSFGSGNSIQAFTVADQMQADLGIPTWLTGAATATLVALVILGGIKRIGAVTSKLVPYMAAIYVTGGLLVLVMNFSHIPGMLTTIVKSAFQPAAQIGGFAGGTFVFMLTWGVKRGLFSNESGQGSAPIAHAAARTDEPVREGVVALMEPMIDTLIICTITGLVILTTGVWTERHEDSVPMNAQSDLTVIEIDGQVRMNGVVDDATVFSGLVDCYEGRPTNADLVRNHARVEAPMIYDANGELYAGKIPVSGGEIDFDAIGDLRLDGWMALNGSPLTGAAFRRGLAPIFGRWGHLIITLGVLLFGVSTAISWSYYGDRSIVYLAGPAWVIPYKIIFCVVHFLGAIFSLEIVWNLGDSALGLMSLPNLIALILLIGTTRRLTRDYFAQEHEQTN